MSGVADAGLAALGEPRLDPLFWRAERIGAPSAWWLHVPFAHWIVAASRPNLLVELGTHAGVSYSAFCQAVELAGLPTRCHAVDAWHGDEHAGIYDESVFEEFSRYHDARFGNFSTLIRGTFDDALDRIEDGSIDLLHIDGLHTYEAVRHDYDSWLPKLSDRAVVLFHDINERMADFGVWRLWRTLSAQHPNFAFLHGHGLGVLAVGERAPAPVLALCALEETSRVGAIRNRFARLGERWLAETRERMVAQRQGEIAAALAVRDRELADAVRAREAERLRADQAEANVERRAAEAEQAAAEASERAARAATELARAAAAAAEEAAAHERARHATVLARAEAERRQLQDALARTQAETEALRAGLQEAIDRHERFLASTTWRATWPLRRVGHKVPRWMRRGLRGSAKLAWWTATFKLPRKLGERRRIVAGLALQPPPAIALPIRAPAPAPAPPALALVPPQPGPGIAASPRLVYVSGEPETPGHAYRVARFAAAAGELGLGVDVVPLRDLAARRPAIAAAGILVIWRASWNDELAEAVAAARQGGARIVFDIDDLMVDPGLARFEVIDGIRSQFLTEEIVRGHYTAIRETMLAADVCFATTDELAYFMRGAGKPVHVLPNGFDQALHDVARRARRAWQRDRTDTLTRIGYAGGSRTHQRDLGLAIAAIARLLRETEDLRLVLFRTPDGTTPLIDVEEYAALAGLEDRIEWRPLQPLASLPNELARFDVNLAPLEFGNPFCEAKSELKFWEAALVEVPTVASPTGPFRRAIVHGRTGFLAASADDWYVCLRRLVTDPALRAEVARRAYHDTLANFGPRQRTLRLGRVIEQLQGGAAGARAFALEAQLAARERRPLKVYPSDVVFEHQDSELAEVTVIVPLYNYAGYVEETLDSVAAQTLRRLDLVIVDGCSTDDSLRVATDWARRNASRFNRLLVLRNRANYGLGFCRNSGFDAADSEFVLPLDADNKLLPGCCETLLRAIRQTRTAYVYPSIQHFGNSTAIIGNVPYDPQALVPGNYIDATALIAKEAWAMVGGCDHVRFGWEDYDLWCRMAELGLRGSWWPEVLALYRVHGASMMTHQTTVTENYARLFEDFTARHRWVVPGEQHSARRLPPPRAELTSAPGRIDALLPILRCPQTGQKLAFNADRTALVSLDGLRSWPILQGRPLLSPELAAPQIMPVEHISNELPAPALELIRGTDGLVLNLSAGGSRERAPNVVEVEYAIFRHTDLVADAHALPFDDESFSAIVVMNAFEHYREPHKVAAELYRILKPGGQVLIRTAFLQPLHERPWHFFNCTRYGLAEWFKAFETEVLHVSENFCPNHSIAWLASESEAALRQDVSPEAAAAFEAATLGELVGVWRDPSRRTTPLWTDFQRMTQTSQEVTAAGFEFLGRKPADLPDLHASRR